MFIEEYQDLSTGDWYRAYVDVWSNRLGYKELDVSSVEKYIHGMWVRVLEVPDHVKDGLLETAVFKYENRV